MNLTKEEIPENRYPYIFIKVDENIIFYKIASEDK